MRLDELGEFPFIDRIRTLAGQPSPEVLVGIGDDCAVLDTGGPERLLVTTDASVQGRHFRLDWLSPEQVGRRAMAAALSDIAAMGGRAIATFASVALPSQWDAADATELMGGLAGVAREYGAGLVGGDCTAADQVMIDVVVLGLAREPWLRSGARVGDVVAVTGDLGAARAGLGALQTHLTAPAEAVAAAIGRFAAPQPRLHVAAVLQEAGGITAGIDISDGILQDSGHIARASGVRIVLREADIPVAPCCIEVAQALGESAFDWALGGGEDYELLICAPAERMAALVAACGIALTVIGDVVAGEGVIVLDRDGQPLTPARSGWAHFSPA